MKPAPFDYVRAGSVEDAVAALAAANSGGEGKVIAGGQSLMPLLALRLAQPSVLVDINRVPGLAFIEDSEQAITIGALTRHHQIETSPVIAVHLPVLLRGEPIKELEIIREHLAPSGHLFVVWQPFDSANIESIVDRLTKLVAQHGMAAETIQEKLPSGHMVCVKAGFA